MGSRKQPAQAGTGGFEAAPHLVGVTTAMERRNGRIRPESSFGSRPTALLVYRDRFDMPLSEMVENRYATHRTASVRIPT